MNSAPLPERIRPEKLDEFIGQKHLVGKDGVIRKLLKTEKKSHFFPSLIFWGPPGSGKTTLARIIANEIDREFFEFSAVNTSTKDIQKVIERAEEIDERQMDLLEKQEQATPKAPIVFLDEIHRFNKAQQDKLLPHVEKGTIVLIGATTENPSFEVIGPLLSRSRVVTFKQLKEKELGEMIKRGLSELDKKINKKAKEFLIDSSNGDARVALVVLEISANISSKKTISLEEIEQGLQRRQLSFDKQGEEHHNTISAYIKSMRASNVDAALYYLARMVESGQDPIYIARRMVIFASEDIGMAQPTALVVANEVFRACEVIGYPECAINLAHGTTYMAKAKKDRSSYEAYFRAVDDVQKYGNLPIPKEILNAPTDLMKEEGYGEGYDPYTDRDLLPDKLKGNNYYIDKDEK